MTDNDKTKIAHSDVQEQDDTELDESLFDVDDSLACGDSSLIIDNITELSSSSAGAIDLNVDEVVDLTILGADNLELDEGTIVDSKIDSDDDSVINFDDDATVVTTNNDATAIIPNTESAVSASGSGFKVGDLLKDRFRLEKMLGEGGMGAVFLAVDQRKVEARHHDPYVAIKLISGEFSQDPLAYIALQRETDKSQKLAHPNVITVYDFDRDGDVFFMTMEALKGRTLDSVIKEDNRSRAQAIEYIKALSLGLAYAHQRNIVHSDVKPPNIFVTDDGVLKVLDFGIARALSAGLGTVQDVVDEVVGLTPAYASCDMFEGAKPDPADDVYAIGIIAYQLLTGSHPFDRKKATVARDAGMQAKRIKGIPAYQWKAIAKALSFERTERWQNADQFYRQFSGAGRRVKQLGIALLAVVITFTAYLSLYSPEAGPEIPFEALSADVQQKLVNDLREADQALQFSDVNGALFYLDRAYALHPRNYDVMEKLNLVVEDIVGTFGAANTPEGIAMGIAQLDELLKYDSLAQNAKLLTLKNNLQAKRAQ
ncbi:Serine/threonine-protein kinase PknA [Zhongshania aliphaticivorans]|uniref:Serine/threonine-protein kinase PknA n=1 Tax=Zhongshania aliphaticivorans TaxID=1470434 RepID=A0A5S9ND77_9GAMM|nr:serine/threonine-protein kinase [Zhongshania aliphaticivorans]CAA0088230.1 Serine/threonine-protein kinase PknA [Zhongshania aliphaticivorans]CAA0116188.1 Serine/threonine-protein kinase PknA [Zhongshania aliphaticivorans]CAA0120381.1 Serine/threonine-protein kinase PknA [Zhongshania aliphaticivorans]